MLIMSYIQCPSRLICRPHLNLEDPIAGITYSLDTGSIICTLIIMICVIFYQHNRIKLAQTVTIGVNIFSDVSLVIILWIICYLIGLELFYWKTFLIELFALCLIIIGKLTYHEILQWKICNLDKNVGNFQDIEIMGTPKKFGFNRLTIEHSDFGLSHNQSSNSH